MLNDELLLDESVVAGVIMRSRQKLLVGKKTTIQLILLNLEKPGEIIFALYLSF